MKRMILLVPLALSFCAHLPAPSCANAHRLRLATALALQTLDRVCPAPIF
jgi:hypothetical protein